MNSTHWSDKYGWVVNGLTPLARHLLSRAIAAAREAGCARLDFFAPPRWRHWPLFRSAGFVKIKRFADLFMYAHDLRDAAVNRLENWQVVPGDHDHL